MGNLGPPDVRGDEPIKTFQPTLRAIAEAPLELQPHLAMPPRIGVTERYLLRVFLAALCHSMCAMWPVQADGGSSDIVRGRLRLPAGARTHPTTREVAFVAPMRADRPPRRPPVCGRKRYAYFGERPIATSRGIIDYVLAGRATVGTLEDDDMSRAAAGLDVRDTRSTVVYPADVVLDVARALANLIIALRRSK